MARSPLLRRLFAVQPLDRVRPEEEGKPKLRRVLGAWGLIGISLRTMLGGLFPTAGVGAQAAGSGVITGFLLSGIACVFVALCYAEFASMVPVAGSAYTYAYATLGELVAWIIGWDLILEYGLSLAPTASSLSDYFQHMLANIGIVFPVWAETAAVHGAHPQIDLFACIVTLAVTMLVAVGIRESANVNGALV